MKENTQEKSLIQVNENSIFYKIKNFFKNLFHKNKVVNDVVNSIETTENVVQTTEQKNTFMESIRNIEDEETKLLKLQKQYRTGKIKAEELSEQQIKSLGKLYDKQIEKLTKSNEIRKQKLLEYRRKLQTDNYGTSKL